MITIEGVNSGLPLAGDRLIYEKLSQMPPTYPIRKAGETLNKMSKYNTGNMLHILIYQPGIFFFLIFLPCEHAIGAFPAFGEHQHKPELRYNMK